MGIRNLAYCLMEHHEDGRWSIESWDNVDLLEGGTSAQDAKKCFTCSGVAKWIETTSGKKWCQACATQTRVKKSATQKPTLPSLPCDLTMKSLRNLAKNNETFIDDIKKAKKDALISWASKHYLMPWKPAKAMNTSLTTIRRAMSTWLSKMLPLFSRATLIRLENQPVMKGPTMKSVQIILFTLLGYILESEYAWTGEIEFVHAGVKTRESVPSASTTTDDGAAYRARKRTAEDETREKLASPQNAKDATKWIEFFAGRSKKSDLADAFLMALRSSV
jgi:hypothetical protein